MRYVLHIGDHAYSSWSLRGWLLLRAFDLPFETRLHAFDGAALPAWRASHPCRPTVPALEWAKDGRAVFLWDSLAIAETLAERHPEKGFWPEAPDARAAARALTAEMHSGFAALRVEAAMNVRRGGRPVSLSAEAEADLARLSTLWSWARGTFGGALDGALDGAGPFLFGARLTTVDVFFAPIVWRVLSYGLTMPEADLAYLRALEAHPAMAEWAEAAWAEPRRIERYEAL